MSSAEAKNNAIEMLNEEIDWVEEKLDKLIDRLSNMSNNHHKRSRVRSRIDKFVNLSRVLAEQLEELKAN